ncbi:hypothetical protein L1987_79259 [Smallanthus sonchifolius]|uniref:Uncharacterized protein n=1 Tax=Smallanthus sonchifolius TaxID=185202 RepID=A0ACB8ZF85_9ASTR|nr:hypothetical protein L1987_79259 [Smallanthus sonchifolius]
MHQPKYKRTDATKRVVTWVSCTLLPSGIHIWAGLGRSGPGLTGNTDPTVQSGFIKQPLLPQSFQRQRAETDGESTVIYPFLLLPPRFVKDSFFLS